MHYPDTNKLDTTGFQEQENTSLLCPAKTTASLESIIVGLVVDELSNVASINT